MTDRRAFEAASVAGEDEPVQRYFGHAIREGARLPEAVAVDMAGRIRAGAWLPFTARQECRGRSFAWSARVRLGPITALTVLDRYADGAGSIEGRLFGRLRLFSAHDPDTTRSAAGRAALENVAFAPPLVLPGPGVQWRAVDEDLIAATVDVPPERTEVEVRIDERGGVRSVSARRWGKPGRGSHGYVACGGEVHEERRFGDFRIPAKLTVGWRFGAPEYRPFFQAEILTYAERAAAQPAPRG